MKLANLAAVGTLKSRLDYLDTVRKALNGRTQARIRVGDLDLRPEIASAVVGHIEQAVLAGIARTVADLATLGVEVE